MSLAAVPTSPDLAVIGGGPAGYGAALAAANAGLSVVLVDAGGLGGTCLHRGCIPAKYLLEAAATFRHVAHAGRFGITTSSPSIDLAVTTSGKDDLVASIAAGLAKLLKHRKVAVVVGTATLHADRTVEVAAGEEVATLTPTSVLLATGSEPRHLDVLPVDGTRILDSNGVLDLDHLPASAVVVGGGAIGCEFASLLADLGTRVHLVEGMDRILAGCDADVARVVQRSFAKRSITCTVGVEVVAADSRGDGLSVTLSNGDSIDADLVVVAVGRRPVLERALGPDVVLERSASGALVVDDRYETSMANVFAAGDVVAGAPQLAHVGFAEAQVVIGHLTGRPLPPVDANGVPWAIYCRPEVAFVGLTEEQASARGIATVVKREPIGGNSRAQIVGETEGLVKVVCAARPDGTAGAILGVHLVGPWATEQLGHGELAVNLGLEVDAIAQFLASHPSLSEQYGETLLALAGRGMHVH